MYVSMSTTPPGSTNRPFRVHRSSHIALLNSAFTVQPHRLQRTIRAINTYRIRHGAGEHAHGGAW